MPLNPAISPQATAPSTPNLASVLGTASQVVGLKSAQQQLNANQVFSQAYQQSIDPTTGQVDFGKLQSLAAQGGAGAFLPQFMGQVAQQRNSQLQYQQGQLNLALQQQQAIRGMIGSLAVDPNLGKTDMTTQIGAQIVSAVSDGLLPLQQGLQEAQNIPKDPADQQTWVMNHLINSLSGEAKIQALMPKQVNTGAQTQNISPLTGQPVSAPLNMTLSPGEAAQRVAGVTPTGTPYTIPLGSLSGGQSVGQPSAPSGAAPQEYTGRYPSASTGAPSVYGTSSPAPNGLPAGAIQIGLSPATQSAMSAQGATSNSAAQALHDAAADAPMRLNLLQTAQDALTSGVDANGSPITTGPGSEYMNTAKSFLNTLSPTIAKAIGYTGQIQSYDEFKKILTNYASSVSGSLGTGTDSRLNAAITGNANPGISTLANQDILAKTIAAEKMRAAQDYAFQNSGLTTDKFNQWQSQWNKAVDPDTFAFTSMNPQQQQQFKARMVKSGQWNSFTNNLATMVNSGLIKMPGQ